MNKLQVHYGWSALIALVLMICLSGVLLAQSARVGRVNRNANLRAGPSTTFAIVGGAPIGQVVQIVENNQDGTWYKLDNGQWIAAFLVTLVPENGDSVSEGFPRPLTGEIMADSRTQRGQGQLTVHNGTKDDGVLALVPPNSDTPVVAFYIRAGERFTLLGIPNGNYATLFTTGSGWNASKGRFGQNAFYQRFEEALDYSATPPRYDVWTVTLHPVEGGTATVNPMAEENFPDLAQP
jgi:hypothetical protein